MNQATGNSPRSTSIPWGVTLAALGLFMLGGGAIIWLHKEEQPSTPSVAMAHPSSSMMLDRVELQNMPGFVPNSAAAIHTITMTEENGTRVVKIQVVPGGEELIIDAATGRLLETRPVPKGNQAPQRVNTSVTAM